MKRLTAIFSLCAAALTAAVSAHAVEPVRVGLGYSKTGQFAATEAGPVAAYQLWVDQVNAKGGLDVKGVRRPIELITYDIQSDTAKTVAVYEKLITDDKVDLLLPPWGSHSHFAIVGLLERYKFPVVGNTASSMQIRQIKAKNIWFPTSSIPDQQAVAMANFLKAGGIKSVALATVQIGYPQENRRALLPELKKAGIQVVFDQEYAPGIQDLTPIVSAIKNAKAEAVLSLSYPNDGILYMKAAREQGLVAPFQYLLIGPTAAFFQKMFGANLEGMVTMGHWSPEKADWPGAREFADEYRKRTGEEPDYLDSSLTYMSCQILEQAVGQAGLDKEALRKVISSTEFSTINGPVRFDGVQNVITPSMFLQFQKDKLQIVWPPEVATAKFEKKTGWAN